MKLKVKFNKWALGHGMVSGLLVGWGFVNNNNFWPTLAWILIGLAYFTGDHRGRQAMHTKVFKALKEELHMDYLQGQDLDEIFQLRKTDKMMKIEDDTMYVISGKILNEMLSRMAWAMNRVKEI